MTNEMKKQRRISEDVLEIVRELRKPNKKWIKAGCFVVVKERTFTGEDGKQKFQQIEKIVTLRKKKKLPKSYRQIDHMPDSAVVSVKLRGKPGTPERVEALARHYQDPENNESPFQVTEDDMGESLAKILSCFYYDDNGEVIFVESGHSPTDILNQLRGVASEQVRIDDLSYISLHKDV